MSHRGLSLSDAQAIVTAVLSLAGNKKSPPLSIALLDSGGAKYLFH